MNIAKRLFQTRLRFIKPSYFTQFRSKLLFLGLFGFIHHQQLKPIHQDQNKYPPQTKKKTSLQIVPFTERDYQQALKDKCDVVVFIDPSRFKDDFIENVEQFLDQLNRFQEMVNGRKLKIFRLDMCLKQRQNSLQNPFLFIYLTYQRCLGCQRFRQKIRCQIRTRLRIIAQKQVFFPDFIIKPNRYVSSFFLVGPYDFFQNPEYILKYFRKISKLNQKDWDKFSKHLDQLTSDQTFIIGYADKKDPNYKQQVRKFGVLTLFRQYCDNKNIHPILINDSETAQKLGITNPGDLHVMVKSSKLNRNSSNLTLNNVKFQIQKSGKILDRIIDQIEANAKAYNDIQTFIAKGFDPENTNFSLVLEVDRNKTTSMEYNRLLQQFGALKQKFKEEQKNQDISYILVKKSRHKQKDDQAFAIYLVDEEKSMTQTKLYQATTKEQVDNIMKSNTDKKQRTYTYFYNFADLSEINPSSLAQWIEDAKQDKVEDHFKSSKKPNYQKYSQKITSDNFKQTIIDNDIDQAVFFYSRNCHACKFYGPVYEELAKKNLQNPDSQIQFNRIDSDLNQLNCSENFPYTPVFAFYKKGAKDAPIIYKNEKFTAQLLEDFINISSNFTLMNNHKFLQNPEQRKQTSETIKSLIQ